MSAGDRNKTASELSPNGLRKLFGKLTRQRREAERCSAMYRRRCAALASGNGFAVLAALLTK